MDMEILKKICAGNCETTNLAGQSFHADDISPRTVRSKGQYSMQRFFYIQGGRAKFELNNKTITCAKGDILYLPPDITYVCSWEAGNHNNAAILIQFDLYVDGEKTSLAEDMFIIHSDLSGKYLNLFLIFAKTYTEGKFGYRIKCQSTVLDILYSLITESAKAPQAQKNDTVYNGILYIENHYMDEIDINALAKACSLSPTAFRSKFRAVTGMSPREYKNHLAMNKAAELLRTGLYTASEVAHAVGIEDVCYFNRMFKSHYGIPPGKYKKSHS